ncbi:hypothetical protein K470DRAFT_223904 [Piedraia hortae CBS 480.64]|uniref:P-loop containing nucleoside triphosphate hydrolase protein n=1 Tax=Piedraia hortae CBS 480.64 TaxID=1314780 RepID=A0A6A7BP62_9PEZI|nr:hypothetical protein K470DRAFT_223904 [Piedraia hortae CBS 480.64]
MSQTILEKTFGQNLLVHPSQWVYTYPRERQVPLQVICVGMPRTGTASLRAALTMLGYGHVHHMSTVLSNIGEAHYWISAGKAKWFSTGRVFTRADWDQVLYSSGATTDFPSSAFADDLIAAYPEAKVVVNYRDVDGWYRSMMDTVGREMTSPMKKFLAFLGDPYVTAWRDLVDTLWGGFFACPIADEKRVKEVYEQHYNRIREMVPPERRYEMRIGEGWEGLCKFLGKDVPQAEYPRVNDRETFALAQDFILKEALKRTLWRVGSGLAIATLAVAAVLYGDRCWDWARGIMNQ